MNKCMNAKPFLVSITLWVHKEDTSRLSQKLMEILMTLQLWLKVWKKGI